jgi:serine/threonine-protein kinase
VKDEQRRKLEQFLRDEEVDLDATYTAFKEQAGGESLDEFLTYLRDNKLIDTSTFQKIHAASDLELTGAVGSGALLESMRYDMFDVISEGAMGEVFVGRDRDLRRKVAIKVLKKELLSSPVMRRFITEAQVTAQLDHPNIIPIYSLEIDPDGNASFAMKLIHGKTLQEFMDETEKSYLMHHRRSTDKEYALNNRLEIMLRVCDAMTYAHSRGVIHRDLKPQNIMIGEFREVYVMDWGISRVVAESEGETDDIQCVNAPGHPDDRFVGQTAIGQVVGTPRYMAPEQAKGLNHKLDARSDLYTLGIILYELVTLKPARRGASITEMLDKCRTAELPPISHRFPAVRIPPELKAIIRKATARDPEDRYESVREFAADLRHFLRGEETLALPDNAFRRAMRWTNRHRQLTLIVVLVVIAVSTLIDSWVVYRQKQAVEAARRREHRRTQYHAGLAAQAHYIDNHFLRYQEVVNHLADMVGYQLSVDTTGEGDVFHYRDLADPGRAPADLAMSPAYRQRISVDHAVYVPAPGVDGTAAEALARRLAPLERHFRLAVLHSAVQNRAQPRDEARIRLREKGFPIRWAYVGLKEGVYFGYPGTAEYPDDYDARERPWYQEAAGVREAVWSDPYVDIEGQHVVLSCARSVYDESARFRGVVAIDLTFEAILQAFLSPAEKRLAEDAYLVDEDGTIIICSSEVESRTCFEVLSDPTEERTFPYPEVLAALRHRPAGQVDVVDGGRTWLFAYQRVPTMGWYYVEKTLLADVVEEPGQNAASN